ncbi:MAG: MXAN_5187 C-terminal domain-containing protein [Polyangiales bacterium]
MSPEEFDTSLTDLETRVDRLRALYENWFRGYEKAEPSVARKDVERKVYALRKELPRNTALRFRYHQLYQRYTTLASYWQRTARQIEEGTYRLQLKRIRRRNDQHSLDENARTIAPRPSLEGAESSAPPAAFELRMDESLDLNKLLDEAALSSIGESLERPAQAAQKSTARRFARPTATFSEPPTGRGFTLEERDREGLPSEPAARRESTPERGAARPSLGPMRSSASSPDVRGSDRMPSGHPTLPPSARIPAANTGAVPGMAAPRVPRIIPPQPPARPSTASLPPPSPKLPAAPNTGTLAAPRPPPPPRPAMPSPSISSGPLAKAPTGPSTGTHTPPKPPPAPKIGAFAAPPPTGGLPKPSPRASVPPARPVPADAGASLPPRPAPRPPPPPPPRPPAPPQAARPAAPPAPRPPAPASEAALGEQRMRRLYDEYAAARRKNNEGDVRYEALQSSIQKMLPDLRKKHQGKSIDFEVVIKDGRVGLKPKAT